MSYVEVWMELHDILGIAIWRKDVRSLLKRWWELTEILYVGKNMEYSIGWIWGSVLLKKQVVNVVSWMNGTTINPIQDDFNTK